MLLRQGRLMFCCSSQSQAMPPSKMMKSRLLNALKKARLLLVWRLLFCWTSHLSSQCNMMPSKWKLSRLLDALWSVIKRTSLLLVRQGRLLFCCNSHSQAMQPSKLMLSRLSDSLCGA